MLELEGELSVGKGIAIPEIEGGLIGGHWELTNFYSTLNLQVKSNL